jgi:hypothetical protein
MREAANLFGISISTVHGTVLKVCHVFNLTFKNVGYQADQLNFRQGVGVWNIHPLGGITYWWYI